MASRPHALAAAALFAAALAVTPVEKVITLLGDLSQQVEREGADEAAAYDKYACFCKSTGENKNYLIKRSTERLEVLDAEITDLDAEITDLNTDISSLSQDITTLGHEIGNATETRREEHEVYVEAEANVSGAIDACDRAIKALQNSKKRMTGKVDREAELAQLRRVAGQVLAAAPRAGATAAGAGAKVLRALVQEPGEAYSSQYHSNDIIQTIKDLRKNFLDDKSDLDSSEYDAYTQNAKDVLGKENEKKFKEEEKAEKIELESKKQERLHDAKEEERQEKADKKSDEEFLEVLQTDCEAKATLWDQRSKKRAEELTALATATEQLKTGVAQNYGANSKLTALLAKAPEPKAKSMRSPSSFLQMREKRRGTGARAVAQRAFQLLDTAAARLNSSSLAAVAMRFEAAGDGDVDHFVKVRALIKDLIDTLESQATEEATQKSFCDDKMSKAIKDRDDSSLEVEEKSTGIEAKEAKRTKTKKEITELKEEIAQNYKSLREATELRAAEKLANEKTVADAKAGKAAVENALQILTDFYGTFLQKGAAPPKSDRDGKTVADRAPKVFDSEYEGQKGASKGIIGLLEVILSDFERTVTQVEQDEKDAKKKFDDFKSETEGDTSSKEGSATSKEDEVTDLTDDLATLYDDRTDARRTHELSQEELTKLRSMCVAGAQSYEERVAQREKEIEALKQALGILEDYQS